ncbi:hypothetical protein C8R43DRAFT_43686 [Mycena crocata]|nr:hypothetical protein C8R43DRAFT_43686 [Mycena crocata]
MSFHNLDEDILTHILTCSDVYTVLQVGRVNKLLHALTLLKEIWLAMIHDLAFRGIVDLPPADLLCSCTTSDLMDEVKRTVLGPKTWSPLSTSPSTIARQHAIHPPVHPPWLPPGFWPRMRLLPGGKYIVIDREGRFLEIRSIEHWNCVWMYHSLTEFVWSIDVQDGYTTAFVLVSYKRFTFDWVCGVKIIRVALDTGEETPLFEQLLPCKHIWKPIVHGNFFLVLFRTTRFKGVIMLVNWRTRAHAVFERVQHTNLEAGLLPNHIIIVSPNPPSLHLTVYEISSITFDPSPLSVWDPRLCGEPTACVNGVGEPDY